MKPAAKSLLFSVAQIAKSDFKWKAYLVAGIVLLFVLGFEFSGNFVSAGLRSLQPGTEKIIGYFLLFATPYFILTYLSNPTLLKKQFLGLNVLFILSLAFSASLQPVHWYLEYFGIDDPNRLLKIKILLNLSFTIGYLIPIFLSLFLFRKFNTERFGFVFSALNFRIYFILFLIMIPFIGLAIFSPGFTSFYPTWNLGREINISILSVTSHEFFYGLNFIATEWFFRGLLILGMIKIFGINQILPVTVLYCLWHIGKPPIEIISSIFGGYFLGLLALQTRSIVG